jgi:hypothetical protein
VFLQIRRHSPGVSSDAQAKRLYPRIAGVSPACGCTQPLVSEVLIVTALSVAYRQSAGETPAIRWSRLLFRIAGVSPVILLSKRLRLFCLDGCVLSQFFCYKKIVPFVSLIPLKKLFNRVKKFWDIYRLVAHKTGKKALKLSSKIKI